MTTPLSLRPLMPEDAAPARALVTASLGGTRYLARTLEQLDAALQFEDPEFLAVLAERDDAAVALALFGTVAGARQCSKLHVLAGGDGDALDALAAGVVQLCEDAGERLVVAELPDDAIFAAAYSALRAAGFREEGRVDDYVADGVGLRLMVWRP
jgi:hypothetical protein